MRIGRVLGWMLGCLMLAACASSGADVEVSYDRGTDFVSEKSYQWVRQPVAKYAPGDLNIRESVLTTLKLHISDSLSAKGYNTGPSPRFLVNYALGAAQNVRVQPGVGGFGAGKYTPFVTTETESVLVIDVQDAASGRSLWRGWAPVSLETGQDRLAAIKDTADAVLSRFPPK